VIDRVNTPAPDALQAAKGVVAACGPVPKIAAVRTAMARADWPDAIRLAAKFPRLGEQAGAIRAANEAVQRPAFQRQIGRDPAVLIEAGKAALIERYGDA